MESIAIGADHAGFQLKEALIAALKARDIAYEDVGCYNEDRVDYPDFADKMVEAMRKNGHSRGILCCGSGVGVAMAANRHPEVRAVTANDLYSAKMSRMHNDSNVLCLGGRVIGIDLALEILDTWLTTPFEGGRHQQRVDKLSRRNAHA